MAVNPYIVLDLMKPANVLTDLTPNFQGRVGDSGSFIKVWFKMNGLPYSLEDKEVWFEGIDPQGGRYKVSSTLDETTPGDSLRSGRVSFKFPAGTFSNPGDWDTNNTFFVIKKGDTGEVLSTINVGLHVLENQVEFGVTKNSFDSDLDKIEKAAQEEYDQLVQQWTQNTKSLNDTMTADYDTFKNRMTSLQAQVDVINAAIKNQDVATREYVAKYIAGDLLGTATVVANQDELYPEGRIRVYTYGAGVPQTNVDMAGGSSVYEAQCRLVYISPELIQVYVSTEQLADLMPGWSMTTPPEVSVGGDTAYLTAGVCSLAIQLKGVKSFTNFAVDGKFQVGAPASTTTTTTTDTTKTATSAG